MIWSGTMVWLGLLLILVKLPRPILLRALGHDVWLDVGITLLAFITHWGTFSGVMAATVAGLLTSFTTSILKHAIGYTKGKTYYPGWLVTKP